jgi:hypothetical protein
MTLVQPRIKLAAVLVAMLVALPSFAAPKRRSVAHPSAGTAFQATVKGVVLDALTNLPVVNANVTFGNGVDTTTSTGAFQIANATAFGASAAVTVTRSGYQPATATVSGAGTHNITIRMNSRPTVTVRLANGPARVVDLEEARFAYAPLFSGYVTTETMCRADGTTFKPTFAQIRRVIGPAVNAANPACCEHQRDAQRVTLELRTGEFVDATFSDSCFGYTIDFVAREHNSGQFVFSKLTEVTEIVFP